MNCPEAMRIHFHPVEAGAASGSDQTAVETRIEAAKAGVCYLRVSVLNQEQDKAVLIVPSPNIESEPGKNSLKIL